MSKESKYILLQSKGAKISLQASQVPFLPYKWIYADKEILVEFYGESWLATNIYAKNKARVSRYIRSIINGVSSDEIEGFINTFIKDHPLTLIDYKYTDIPLIAEKIGYCELFVPIFQYPIKLTFEQEKEVLNIIASQDIDKKEENVLSWLQTYCQRYGIEARLKRDRAIQYEELMWYFMYIHGLHRFPTKPRIISPELSRSQIIKRWVLLIGGFMLYLYIAIQLIYFGDKIDNMWIGMAFSLFGFIMIALPLSYFLKK